MGWWMIRGIICHTCERGDNVKRSTKQTPKKLCRDCIHVSACSAQNGASMERTDATNCFNHETVYEFLDRVKPLLGGK